MELLPKPIADTDIDYAAQLREKRSLLPKPSPSEILKTNHLDWECDFVIKGLSAKEIAAKYGKDLKTVEARRANGKWVKKRKDYLSKSGNKIRDRLEKQVEAAGFDLITALEELVRLKVTAETSVFLKAHGIDEKDIMHLVNKSKDSISELTKTVQLLKGKATENIGGSVGVEIYEQMLKRFNPDRRFDINEPLGEGVDLKPVDKEQS